MLRCMDSAVAGLRAHQNKMDVVGNNIANVNTVGFKAQTYTFQDAMYQTSSASTGGTERAGGTNAAQYGYGALMGSIGMDMTASTPFYANGLTACIDGEGFFLTSATKLATGADPTSFKGQTGIEWAYTRVGDFTIDNNGYLVDSSGNFVYGFQTTAMSTAGEATFGTTLLPLKVPTTFGTSYTYGDKAGISTNVSINSLGEVTATVQAVDAQGKPTGEPTAGVSLGKVAVVTFQNPNGLTKTGGNYFSATGSDNTGDAVASMAGNGVASLMPGYLEASNVDLAQEFSDMITTHRGFQANSKMITVADEMLSDLVSMKR